MIKMGSFHGEAWGDAFHSELPEHGLGVGDLVTCHLRHGHKVLASVFQEGVGYLSVAFAPPPPNKTASFILYTREDRPGQKVYFWKQANGYFWVRAIEKGDTT